MYLTALLKDGRKQELSRRVTVSQFFLRGAIGKRRNNNVVQ